MFTRVMSKRAMVAALVAGVVAAGAAMNSYRALAAGPATQTKATTGQAPPSTWPTSRTILRMAGQWNDTAKDPGGTIWRYFETWQTDVVRTDDGQLVRVAPYVFRKQTGTGAGSSTAELATTQAVTGSPLPPAGWEAPDFDDGDWQRQPGPMHNKYRSIALTCIRGRFEVREPLSVKDPRRSYFARTATCSTACRCMCSTRTDPR